MLNSDSLDFEDLDLNIIARVVHEHHENVDGTGYPNKLAGKDIHLLARICAIADFFDAITTKRSYAEVMTMSKALEVMESIIQANPNIQGVFCGNDAMAMGAYQALVGAGIADSVKVFGFDGADDVVSAIQEGKITATGMQFPNVMAERAAIFADEYLRGKRDFAQKIPVAVELVTAENVENYAAYGE